MTAPAIPCPTCRGEGRVFVGTTCWECHGSGVDKRAQPKRGTPEFHEAPTLPAPAEKESA